MPRDNVIHVRVNGELYEFIERLRRAIGARTRSDAVRWALGLAKALLDSMEGTRIEDVITRYARDTLRDTVVAQKNKRNPQD